MDPICWFLMIILQQDGLAVSNHQYIWNTPLGHFSIVILSTGAVSDVGTAFHLRDTAKGVSNSQTRSMILDPYLHLRDPLPHCKRSPNVSITGGWGRGGKCHLKQCQDSRRDKQILVRTHSLENTHFYFNNFLSKEVLNST